jgi:hypothetical protein
LSYAYYELKNWYSGLADETEKLEGLHRQHREPAASQPATAYMKCTIGWVDFGTVTRVPLRFVVSFSKGWKIAKKNHFPI